MVAVIAAVAVTGAAVTAAVGIVVADMVVVEEAEGMTMKV